MLDVDKILTSEEVIEIAPAEQKNNEEQQTVREQPVG
jgi:hypothetical protein